MGGQVNAGGSGKDAGPGLGHGISYRADTTQTCDDNTTTAHSVILKKNLKRPLAAFQAGDDKGGKALSFGVSLGVINGELDGGDAFGIFVGNLNAKLVFECHDQFDGVQGVSAQIGHKDFFAGDLLFCHAKLLGNDFLNA
jgi:hypothetical protein